MGKLRPTSALSGFHREWPGLTIQERNSGELVSLACANEHEKDFEATFKKVYGKSLPTPNEMIAITGGRAFWAGQSQYMFLIDRENLNADTEIAARFGEAAYATLQTDGWASIDITGERVFDVLERFTALDLRRAPEKFATRTSAHHIAAIFLKFSETEIRILTPRSSAQSFVHALTHVANNVIS